MIPSVAVSVALGAAVASAAAAAAQSTIISVLNFPLSGVDMRPDSKAKFVGSVVNVENQVTTVVLHCDKGAASTDCFAPTRGLTVAQGPSTWNELATGLLGDEDDSVVTASCKLDAGNDQAACGAGQLATAAGKTTVKDAESTTFAFKKFMVPVTVTAGVEKLSAGPTKTGAAGTGATGAGASGSAATGTNAAPAMTQNAVLVGAAAAIGAMVL